MLSASVTSSIAGLAEPHACPDGIFEIGHGRAA